VLGKTAFDPRKKSGTLGKSVRVAKKAWTLLKQESKPGIHTASVQRKSVVGRDKTGKTMPDLRGSTMRQAVKAVMELGLVPVVRGTGKVARQHPRPGAAINRQGACKLICSRLAGRSAR
jgi:hypothetical protein